MPIAPQDQACVAVALLAFSLVTQACRSDHPDTSSTPESTPSSLAAPPPSAASATPPPPAPPALPALAERKVAGKTLSDGGYIGEYTFRREASDEGLAWLAAEDHCEGLGLHLCTSTQWQTACEADPAIAAVETWTITPERKEGFVVRGGQEGCLKKSVASGAQSSPFRGAACCSPAIACSGKGISPVMLRAMMRNVLDLEKTMNSRRASALKGFFDDKEKKVRIFTAEKTPAEALAIFEFEFNKNPDYGVVHELCDFSADDADNTYTGDCRKIARQGGKIGHVLTRYVFVGGSGKLRSMTDPNMYRPFSEP